MKRTGRVKERPVISGIELLFIAGFGPISVDPAAARALYQEALGIPFKEEEGHYLHTDALEGVKQFAVWPLGQAAQSCFGTSVWPPGIPTPQAWIEFEVEDIARSTAELQRRGYRLLVSAKTEPWGQTVTRFLGPEGLLVGVTHTPWMRPK